jgi:hypothetical protein
MRTARLIGMAVIIGATVGEATPFHHLSEDSHINCSLRAGPITASGYSIFPCHLYGRLYLFVGRLGRGWRCSID